MILWNVEQFNYQPLLGYRFDTFNSISNDFYYTGIDNPNYQIFGQNIWWKQLDTPYTQGYSVFDELGVSTETTEGQLSLNSLTFLRFTRNDSPGKYWMILPDIVDNPFKDFSPQLDQYGDLRPQIIITASNLSESPQTFQALASSQYQSQAFWKDTDQRYSLHDLLASSVRCISGCTPTPEPTPTPTPSPTPTPTPTPSPTPTPEPTPTPSPTPEPSPTPTPGVPIIEPPIIDNPPRTESVPEPSFVLVSFLLIGLRFCSRMFKR